MIQQKTTLAKQSGPHFFETKGPHAPKWYIVDAKGLVLGRLATVLAKVLTGKHKPTYTPHVDAGDFVIVINADKIELTNAKWDDKIYYKHTGFLAGMKSQTAKELRDKHPEELIKKAVWGMTSKSSLARHQVSKLKVYAGEQHPHEAQKAEPLPSSVTRKTILS